MKKYLSAFLCLTILTVCIPATTFADDAYAVLTSNANGTLKSGYTLTAQLFGADGENVQSTVFEYCSSSDGTYVPAEGDDTSDDVYVIENSVANKFIRATVNTDGGSYTTEPLFCGANLAHPIGWNGIAPGACEKSPDDNKLAFTNGTSSSSELIMLENDGEKTLLLGPDAGYIAFYADGASQPHQIFDINDEKSLMYKANQSSFLNKYVLPADMQEYLISTQWETEAGYALMDKSASNMQNDTVTEALAAPISANEYFKYADKIGYADCPHGLLLRTPAASAKCMLECIAVSGKLTYGNTYSTYFNVRPVFYVSNDIFSEVKLSKAGSNVRNMLLSKYSVPELMEMGYTEDELASIGIDAAYPVCSNAYIEGASGVGSALSARYTYTHTADVAEGASVFKWYRTDVEGNEILIDGADKSTYVTTSEDCGYSIFFTVTPYDAKSNRGMECKSEPSQVINDSDFAVTLNSFILSGDGTASADYAFANMNGREAMCVLAVYSGYKLVNVCEKSVTSDGNCKLEITDTCENAYAKTYVINSDTNTPLLLSLKNENAKPDVAVDKTAPYTLTADSQREIYIIGGKNDDVCNDILHITVSEKESGKILCRDAEKVTDGVLKHFFNMPANAKAGEYSVNIYGRNLKEPVSLDFYYSSAENKAEILEKLSPIADAAEFAKTILSNLKELEISDKYVLAMTQNDLEYIGKRLLGNSYGKDNITKFYADLSDESALYMITHLKDEKDAAECADYYSDRFNFDKSPLYTNYDKLADTQKYNVFEMFFGREVTSFDSAIKLFEESVVLNRINNAQSYGKLHAVLIEYENVLPFSLDNYKNSDTAKASLYIFEHNDGLKNMTELENAVAAAISAVTSSGGGGGGSSTSGSKSGKTVSSATVSTGYVPDKASNDEFADVADDHWAYRYIYDLKKRKIISGDGNNRFKPDENITREEFVKLVVEAFKIPVGSYEVTFSDVDKTRWSYECISAAASGGIIGGTGNGKFSPEDCITREDMAVIIIKVKELSAEGNNQTFADDGDISAYATGAVHSLARRGIINGFGDSTFRPKEFATRSQAAKIICAMLDARY